MPNEALIRALRGEKAPSGPGDAPVQSPVDPMVAALDDGMQRPPRVQRNRMRPPGLDFLDQWMIEDLRERYRDAPRQDIPPDVMPLIRDPIEVDPPAPGNFIGALPPEQDRQPPPQPQFTRPDVNDFLDGLQEYNDQFLHPGKTPIEVPAPTDWRNLIAALAGR